MGPHPYTLYSQTLLTTERNNQLLHVQKRSYCVPYNTTSKLLPFKVNPMASLGTKPGGHNSSTHMITMSIHSYENAIISTFHPLLLPLWKESFINTSASVTAAKGNCSSSSLTAENGTGLPKLSPWGRLRETVRKPKERIKTVHLLLDKCRMCYRDLFTKR